MSHTDDPQIDRSDLEKLIIDSVRGAIGDFVNSHPGGLNPDMRASLCKRVAGHLYGRLKDEARLVDQASQAAIHDLRAEVKRVLEEKMRLGKAHQKMAVLAGKADPGILTGRGDVFILKPHQRELLGKILDTAEAVDQGVLHELQGIFKDS